MYSFPFYEWLEIMHSKHLLYTVVDHLVHQGALPI